VRKSDLLAELTDVLSDGVSQDLWLLTIGIDNKPWGPVLAFEYRQNWLLHLQRMPQNRIPLKSYYYRPQGRRTFGRPKKRWRKQL